MNESAKTEPIRRILFSVQRYFSFFMLMSFIISCCMMLFLKSLQIGMGMTFTKENIQFAVKLTFLNVILLSFICTVFDGIRRKFMVERPVRKITQAAEKIMKGDFSARIEPIRSPDSMDGFNQIIGYFNRMAEELAGTEILRTDFIANVSHELKTPLAVIQNYGTMLQQPELSEEKRMEYAKAITNSSGRLANMISNILKLNKLENQTIYPDVREYDLGEQLCECLLAFEDAWEKKGLEIQTDIQEDVRMTADPELLCHVWNNLFSNAIKFTEPGGVVSLLLMESDDTITVSVSDTGCGISPEVGKHIFEKFYQGDTSHATKGNGLGLALVKRVIEITGGDISVKSEVGRGSTFIVSFRR